MNLAISDYCRLRELIAEQGVELTPEQFSVYLNDLVGQFQLVDETGIADCRERGEELNNRWFAFMVSTIIKKAL
jgi:hypothetical protein